MSRSRRRRPAAAREAGAPAFLADSAGLLLSVNEPKPTKSARWRLALRSIAETPDFLRQPCVLSGYRKELTAWEAARSAFEWHNETGSIWTHAIGAIFFVVLAFRLSCGQLVGEYADGLRTPVTGELNDTLAPLWELPELGQPIADCETAADCLADLKEWAFAPRMALWSAPLVDGGEMLERRDASAGLHKPLRQARTAGQGVYEGVRRLVQDAGNRFGGVVEKVSASALPPSCANNATATWSTCIPLLESLEAAMLGAGGELRQMSARLQSTVICGDSQCFNLTAAVILDERVAQLIQQAQGNAQLLFTEALAKAAVQTSFVRDAVKEDLSALRGHASSTYAAYRQEGKDFLLEGQEKLETATMSGKAAAERVRGGLSRLLNNATKTMGAVAGVGVPVGLVLPGWSELRSARSAGWARAVEAIREVEENLASVAFQDEAGSGSAQTDYTVQGDFWALVGYLISATICLGLSAIYHCFGTAMSRPMHDLFARLDFAGITTLIYGSGFAIIYYTFYCRPLLQQCYLGVFSVLGLPKMFLCTTKWYTDGQRRTLRTTNFVLFGFSLSGFFMHGICLETGMYEVVYASMGSLWQWAQDGSDLQLGDYARGPLAGWGLSEASVEVQKAREEIWWLFARVLATGGAYLSGTVVFVTHLPESKWPGRFDNCCSSHQLWHIFVTVAAYILWTGLRDYATWRTRTQCPA